MSKVSIIIPTYNSYQFMGKCLASLERQTYNEFEIVIIDDCSTDDTYGKIQDYMLNTAMDIKLYRLEKNSGPGVARNFGILNSTGEWIAFCDSDDWYEDEFLQKTIKEVETSKADIVMVDYYTVYGNDKKTCNGYTSLLKDFTTKKEIIAYSRPSLCNLLVKKMLLIENQIPNLYNGEDIATIPILLSKAERISIIDQPLYNYYLRENSISNRADSSIYESLLNAFEIIKNNLGEEYFHEIEFIGIETVLYGVTLTALKAKVSDEIIINEIQKFISEFKSFNSNKYYKNYNLLKKIYIFFSANNFLFFCKIFSSMHKKRTRSSFFRGWCNAEYRIYNN